MNCKPNEYSIVNIFTLEDEEKRKEKANSIVKSLCMRELEKAISLDYNVCVTLESGTSETNKNGVAI